MTRREWIRGILEGERGLPVLEDVSVDDFERIIRVSRRVRGVSDVQGYVLLRHIIALETMLGI